VPGDLLDDHAARDEVRMGEHTVVSETLQPVADVRGAAIDRLGPLGETGVEPRGKRPAGQRRVDGGHGCGDGTATPDASARRWRRSMGVVTTSRARRARTTAASSGAS
jgi:hypothetical protein